MAKATGSPTAQPANGADPEQDICQQLALTGQCAMTHTLTNWPGFAPSPWLTFAPPLTILAAIKAARAGDPDALDSIEREFLRLRE